MMASHLTQIISQLEYISHIPIQQSICSRAARDSGDVLEGGVKAARSTKVKLVKTEMQLSSALQSFLCLRAAFDLY